jgi:hypothetical protein
MFPAFPGTVLFTGKKSRWVGREGGVRKKMKTVLCCAESGVRAERGACMAVSLKGFRKTPRPPNIAVKSYCSRIIAIAKSKGVPDNMLAKNMQKRRTYGSWPS